MKPKRIAIGCDHRGVQLKNSLITFLKSKDYEIFDCGSASEESSDYPDFGSKAASAVARGECDRGIVICHSGIGMSIVANKVKGVRASLCATTEAAELARKHNDANVLALGAGFTGLGDAEKICTIWLETEFEGGRHERRKQKISDIEKHMKTHEQAASALRETDPKVFEAIRNEWKRQNDNLEMIASENFASLAVLEAQGSVLTNKYAEGYPGKRWYGGCDHVDICEQFAIDRAKELFGAEHANVQPHSGTTANIAVFVALLNMGDKILAMNLSHGGHLSHGHKMNFSGKYYEIIPYGVNEKTEQIDYDELERLALTHKPKMILLGASAYPRVIDFKRGREIADKAGALLMVDMAHFAGLVAAGIHPNPVPYADIVTSTTHKTLRGPRGGLILCRSQYGKAIDSTIFPGVQGGPLMHVVAAKAVAFQEALTGEFRAYQKQVAANAKKLASELQKLGFRIVSGGTDNHLLLVDVKKKGFTGKEVQLLLDEVRITVNKNMIPFDQESAFNTSGIRLGTPAVTTRGLTEAEMSEIASLIHQTLSSPKDENNLAEVRNKVELLTKKFPLYPGLYANQ